MARLVSWNACRIRNRGVSRLDNPAAVLVSEGLAAKDNHLNPKLWNLSSESLPLT